MEVSDPTVVSRARARGRHALVVVVLWHAYGLYSVNHTYFYNRIMEASPSWTAPIPVVLVGTWLWILFTPLIVWVAPRVLGRFEAWTVRIGAHLVLAVGFAAVDAGVDYLRQFVYALSETASFPVYFLYQLDHNIMLYALVVSVVYGRSWQKTLRARERQAARLETQLARSELQVLKMQLQPHFLFNTLNSIAALVHRDADAADRMVTKLSELLRMSLVHGARQEVPLEEEVSLLKAYVEIQETRFRGRLTVTIDVGPGAPRARVPHLFLQPLVENAVKHGFRDPPGRVAVRVTARAAEGRLRLEVTDDGPGFPVGQAPQAGGIGLINARARLRQLYPGRHTFTTGNRDGGGAFVRVSVPLRTMRSAAPRPAPPTPQAV